MKYLLAICFLSGVSFADGFPSVSFPGNPDQRASIGIAYDRTYEDGNNAPYTSVTRPDGSTIVDATRVTYGATVYTLDLRVPVHNNVTVTVNGGPSSMEFQGDRVSGFHVGVGARFYLGGR